MSYSNGAADFSSGFQQYSESDILDFITHGQGDLPPADGAFGTLEGAEDMMFGNFSSFSSEALYGGLGDRTGIPAMLDDSEQGFPATSTSQHASFMASTSTAGVGSIRDYNTRMLMEQQQFLHQQPITPLRDTPHTPTNTEMNNRQHSMSDQFGGSNARAQMRLNGVPAMTTVSSKHVIPQHHLAVTSTEDGAEGESTELREFVDSGSLVTDPTLDHVQLTVQTMQKQVDDMRRSQTNLLQAMSENLVSELTDNTSYITSIQEMIDFQTECLNTTKSTSLDLTFHLHEHILSAHDVERANILFDELAFISATVSLLQQELLIYLSWIKDGGEVPNIAQLVSVVIARGPFPSIWMKRNQMSEAESIVVRLIHGCSVTLTQVSEVKAIIHCHTAYTAKTTPAKPIIDFDMFPMDPTTLSAACQFIFTAGSRKDVAQCRFVVTVQGSCFATTVTLNRGNQIPAQVTTQIVSPDSKPFIVITNECQYGETFGILFQKDVFHHQWGEAREEIPWPFFANSIQRYFIRSTRQDPISPKRGLSIYDLEHIHAHFFASEPSIHLKPFAKFWDWFGKVLHRLRYQRHMAALWTEGLVSGMVSREGVCAQLISRPPGTFLLRFSESSAGFIAIGYRVSGANAGIKNYLVKPEDTASATVKTLPDYIRSRPEFGTILQYTGQHLEDGFPILYPIHKDFALKAYCAARPTKPVDPKAGSPYDEL